MSAVSQGKSTLWLWPQKEQSPCSLCAFQQYLVTIVAWGGRYIFYDQFCTTFALRLQRREKISMTRSLFKVVFPPYAKATSLFALWKPPTYSLQKITITVFSGFSRLVPIHQVISGEGNPPIAWKFQKTNFRFFCGNMKSAWPSRSTNCGFFWKHE